MGNSWKLPFFVVALHAHCILDLLNPLQQIQAGHLKQTTKA
jgi:hypothetical protein